MPSNRNALVAGFFILTCIGLAVFVMVKVQGWGVTLVERRVAFALADDIGGLRPGDDVRLGGFKVGNVRAIQIDGLNESGTPAAAEPRIVVTFGIPSRYALSGDATVGIQSSLTGASVLNITSLGNDGNIDPGTVLAGTPSPLTALLASLGRASDDVGPIVASVRTTVEQLPPVAQSVRETTLPKVNQAVGQYTDAGEHLSDMLGGSKADFKTTMANVSEATGQLKEDLPKTFADARELIEKLNGTVTELQASLADVKQTMANARDASGHVKDLLGRNRSRFDGIVASLKTTGDNLKAASAEIRRSPWRLLYKPGANEMANLNLYDTARQFAEGAGELNNTASALRDLLQTENADPADVRALLEKLDASFTKFSAVEEKLWTSVKE